MSTTDASSTSSTTSGNGIAISALVIAIIGVILTVIIWIIYFVQREENGGSGTSSPRWNVQTLNTGQTSIGGENYGLYILPNTASNASTSFTIANPSGSQVGDWFGIYNDDPSPRTINGSFAVAGSSYSLPGRNTVFIARLSQNNDLKIVIPTNVTS